MSNWKCHMIHCRALNAKRAKKCWKCGEAVKVKLPKKKK